MTRTVDADKVSAVVGAARNLREALALGRLNRPFIDGELVDSEADETFACVNPSTGEVLGEVAAGGAADIDRAVRSARVAFDDGRWSQRSPRERKTVLFRFAELMVDHQPRPPH